MVVEGRMSFVFAVSRRPQLLWSVVFISWATLIVAIVVPNDSISPANSAFTCTTGHKQLGYFRHHKASTDLDLPTSF